MPEVRTGWPALVAGVVLLAALQLWLRPLLPVDETRYLSVAWEMWLRGDFLVPHLNGEPYSHKPPLLFWLIQGLWVLFGVSPWPARLLPVGLSLLALWGTARLAMRLWPQDAQARALAPWLLFGSGFWMNFYTLVQFDLLLVLAALAAWWGIWRAVLAPLTGWGAAGLAVGAGVLAKGPVILVVVLPPLLLAPWWLNPAPAGGWWRWYAGGAAALLLGTAVALAWALPAGLAGGAAYREAIFWGQSAGRMVASFAHRSPWWSYLLWLPLLWLPWIAWPALWRGLRRLSGNDPGVRFCLSVVLPALVVFSLISGKQAKYLLPLLPLLALLGARGLSRLVPSERLVRPWPGGLLLGLAGIVLVSLPWWPLQLVWRQPLALLCGAALLVAALPYFGRRVSPAGAVRGMTLAMLLATSAVYAAVVPALAPQYRLQPLATRLAELQQQGRALAWLGRYHAQFQFIGRLRAPLVVLHQPGELRGWLADHPAGYVVVRYPQARPDVPADLTVQAYRSGALVLWPAQRLLQDPRLDALAGNA